MLFIITTFRKMHIYVHKNVDAQEDNDPTEAKRKVKLM